MEKKVIVGISAYAGSNTPRILAILEFMLTFEGYPPAFYSLNTCSLDCIVDRIKNDEKKIIHIIDDISMPEEIDMLENSFADEKFLARGIEVPWEECLEFLQRQGEVVGNVVPREWRDMIKNHDPYRKSVLACHEKMGTIREGIYLCQAGSSYYDQIGAFTDEILSLAR